LREKTLEVTCILCPVGCRAKVNVREGEITRIENIECERGEDYVSKEVKAPMRDFFATVRIKGAKIPLLPVRATGPVPKEKLMECSLVLANIEVSAPVKLGDVIVEDILGLGVDVVATRDLG
jgi:CxxC motif-containing protein